MLNGFLRYTFILSGAWLYLIGNNAIALVKSAEGRDELAVTGTLATGYDSNINSAHEGKSDIITSTTLAVDFARNAGLIGVNGELSWTRADFAENAEESFSDPSLNLEFSKIKGRVTGSITLSAARESQADPALNQRTVSWNYNTAFNWKYPVIDRYSLGGALSYGLIQVQPLHSRISPPKAPVPTCFINTIRNASSWPAIASAKVTPPPIINPSTTLSQRAFRGKSSQN